MKVRTEYDFNTRILKKYKQYGNQKTKELYYPQIYCRCWYKLFLGYYWQDLKYWKRGCEFYGAFGYENLNDANDHLAKEVLSRQPDIVKVECERRLTTDTTIRPDKPWGNDPRSDKPWGDPPKTPPKGSMMYFLIWLALIPVALHLSYSLMKKVDMMDDDDSTGFWFFTFFSILCPWTMIPTLGVLWLMYWLVEDENRTAWMICFDTFKDWITRRYK